MGALTKLQRGAVYIVISMVTGAIGRLLEPGIFDSDAPWNDLVAQRRVMLENSTLEHVSSLLYAFSLLWFLAALMTIWDHVRDDDAAGTAVRAGVLLAGLTTLIMAVIEGLDHMAVRSLTDGIGAGADTDQIALSLLSAKLGIILFVWPIFYIGIALAAFGMMRLLPGGAHRVISGVTALVSVVTAVLVVLVEHIEANEFWQAMTAVLGIMFFLWAVVLAHAMWKGRLASSAS